MLICTLCQGKDTALLYKAESRAFYRCSTCDLVFVPQGFHLSLSEEKKRYDSHQNDPDDDRYREFLSRLLDPLLDKVGNRIKDLSILDYGCGPGPTISVMLAEYGATVENYDPFYANQTGLLKRSYDIITATEVVEHFCRPQQEFFKLRTLLNPGGTLALMTTFADKKTDFSTWWYAKDPTHICFYSKDTFRWIAENYKATLEFPRDNVVFIS